MSAVTVAERALVDARLGLLTDVARQPRDRRMPASWVAYGARVARTDRWSGWRADGFGFGASLGDEAVARAAAVGEAVERYCGNAIPTGLLQASYTDLRAAGDDALDPAALALYSPRQHAQPGFPFTPFTRDLTVAWTLGTDLATSAPLWVPASLCWLDYFHGTRAGEPATHSLMYSGIATGPDRASAEHSALLELLERDACTIWWASGAPCSRLDDDGLITAQLGRPAETDTELEVGLLNIPSPFQIPVVAAFLRERAAGYVAFGSACRPETSHASAKALVEALGLLQLTRQLDAPTSPAWNAVQAGEIEAHVFLPHRADRSYLDAAGGDYRNLNDLPQVAQLYLDPRMHPHLDRLQPVTGQPLHSTVRTGTAGQLSSAVSIAGRLAADGIRVVSVDLTTPDVAACGLSVVRVIGAGLIGNAPPAFPLRGGTRLYTEPQRLGLTSHPLSETELITHPIPLA